MSPPPLEDEWDFLIMWPDVPLSNPLAAIATVNSEPTGVLCDMTFSSIPCAELASAVYDGGCAHEHTVTGVGVCPLHVKLAERAWRCTSCDLSGKFHRCEVRLRARAHRTSEH